MFDSVCERPSVWAGREGSPTGRNCRCSVGDLLRVCWEPGWPAGRLDSGRPSRQGCQTVPRSSNQEVYWFLYLLMYGFNDFLISWLIYWFIDLFTHLLIYRQLKHYLQYSFGSLLNTIKINLHYSSFLRCFRAREASCLPKSALRANKQVSAMCGSSSLQVTSTKHKKLFGLKFWKVSKCHGMHGRQILVIQL